MTEDQATTVLFNVMMTVVAEILDHHGLFDKAKLASLVDDLGGSYKDETMKRSCTMLADAIRTGLPPRLTVIDGGKPSEPL